MPQDNHKACYGTMFPSLLSMEADQIVPGKVFSLEIVRSGGTYVSYRRIMTNRQEWDDCLACPEFQHCYQLGMGTLALESAIAR